MNSVCPTITAKDSYNYRLQMEAIKPFANRVHIDLMDGKFAPTISPELSFSWWYDGMDADMHLMYQKPMLYIEDLVKLKPSLVVIHIEADADFSIFAEKMHFAGIKAGLAILSDTPVEYAFETLSNYDHVLIFSGHLGYHGGKANLGLIDKVKIIRTQFPNLEISWDGGINDQNAKQIVDAGVNVLNVGSFIQGSSDPAGAYAKIKTAI
jgi:ribulose-phosphate 3-epimerase